ncbi:GntR family transcriptional regulator [Actinomadura montaniterrae]|uniref:GntR family transcriptional regulator n=1 Tax=Actinomadura montaniterrae TaxID=1803903 RepID=A0A6L3VQF4_9ACTN|nr:GntR family transcriptional regulator [Actinomadura montaniterrae]KAB2379036.1 GntR family transcriptional regulator [Actinomadura montaniterrae]
MARPPGADRPLYVRIAMSLKSRILAGHYAPGQRLPGEDDLAAAMGASRSTVRQALTELRDTGYVTSRRGSGSYVADPLPIEPLSPRSGPVYTGFLDDLDNEAHHVVERDRVQEELLADEALAARLKVPVGAPVVRYRATRLRHGVPYGVATDVLPRAVADRITPDVLDASPTIVDALALAGSRVAESLQRLEPAVLDAADARRCGTSAGDPALAITGTAYDAGRAPIDAYTLTVVTGYGIGLHLTRATTADGSD